MTEFCWKYSKKNSLQDGCINYCNCSNWLFTYSGNIRKWFFHVGKSISFTRGICSVFSLFQALPICIYSIQFQEPDRWKSAQKVNENAWWKPEIISYNAYFNKLCAFDGLINKKNTVDMKFLYIVCKWHSPLPFVSLSFTNDIDCFEQDQQQKEGHIPISRVLSRISQSPDECKTMDCK